MALFDIHDVGQIATLIGIPSLMFGLYMQIRSYKKDQKIEAEKNRAAITKEITDNADTIFLKIETRLEAIKIAAIISKDDIQLLKTQLTDLRRYVDTLDKEGTIEWRKTKPFIMKKIEDMECRIDELDSRFQFRFEMPSRDELKRQQTRMDDRLAAEEPIRGEAD